MPRLSVFATVTATIALAFLGMTSGKASTHQHGAETNTHQYKYCRHLSNGDVRICDFDSMKQCKGSSSRCERYPFLAYCHFSPTGSVQRCDFDTVAECKATESGFDGYCGPSPWPTTPESPARTARWKDLAPFLSCSRFALPGRPRGGTKASFHQCPESAISGRKGDTADQHELRLQVGFALSADRQRPARTGMITRRTTPSQAPGDQPDVERSSRSCAASSLVVAGDAYAVAALEGAPCAARVIFEVVIDAPGRLAAP